MLKFRKSIEYHGHRVATMMGWRARTTIMFLYGIHNYKTIVGGRLHNTVCMARCGLLDAFVWLGKSETIEDHVLYYTTVVNRCTS